MYTLKDGRTFRDQHPARQPSARGTSRDYDLTRKTFNRGRVCTCREKYLHGMNHVVLMLYLANSLSSRIEPTSPAYTPYRTQRRSNYVSSRHRLSAHEARTLDISDGESSPPYEPSLVQGLRYGASLRSWGTHHPATASTSTPNPTRILRGIFKTFEVGRQHKGC